MSPIFASMIGPGLCSLTAIIFFMIAPGPEKTSDIAKFNFFREYYKRMYCNKHTPIVRSYSWWSEKIPRRIQVKLTCIDKFRWWNVNWSVRNPVINTERPFEILCVKPRMNQKKSGGNYDGDSNDSRIGFPKGSLLSLVP